MKFGVTRAVALATLAALAGAGCSATVRGTPSAAPTAVAVVRVSKNGALFELRIAERWTRYTAAVGTQGCLNRIGPVQFDLTWLRQGPRIGSPTVIISIGATDRSPLLLTRAGTCDFDTGAPLSTERGSTQMLVGAFAAPQGPPRSLWISADGQATAVPLLPVCPAASVTSTSDSDHTQPRCAELPLRYDPQNGYSVSITIR